MLSRLRITHTRCHAQYMCVSMRMSMRVQYHVIYRRVWRERERDETDDQVCIGSASLSNVIGTRNV